ncbi:protein-disulfide isomerase-like protein with CxxC motif [Streptomyces sp. B4I13]|uniref:hypothetical protein n=1 Tax=Streptomyces sp. B4I13 TaxID=3042271 RepID=UPI002783D9CB|nr:hypothetical protein [Streptomyces sp. B4I13]MDQ0956662.1 protein-disulfide isomerase-like protein with CxxC motif [Streptomyces sp. B4I13]
MAAKDGRAAGLGAEDAAAFGAPGTRTAAEADFARAAGLGVDGFPTLLAVDGERTTAPARGRATADDVERRLAAFSATRPS